MFLLDRLLDVCLLLVLRVLHSSEVKLLVPDRCFVDDQIPSEVRKFVISKNYQLLANGIDEIAVMGHQHNGRWVRALFTKL